MTEMTIDDALALAEGKGEHLYHTATGKRVHIYSCMHFELDSQRIETTPDNIGDRTICVSYCAKELSGHGRQHPANVDDAFRRFQLPVEAQATARAEAAKVDFDDLWIPYSNSYIAFGRDGYAQAWILKSEFRHKDGRSVPFDLVDVGPVLGSSSRPERPAQFCPEHPGIALPLSGKCEECA